MASFEYDTVKAENAHAIRRYNLKRACSLCLCLSLPLGLLLYCCFWSFPYFPVIKETLSAYLSILGKKFYVFLLANLLGLAVWCLSTVPPAAASKGQTFETSHAAAQPVELHDQYASISSAASKRKTYETSHAAPQPVELHDRYASFSSAACSSRRCRSLSPAPTKETQLVISLPRVESKSTPFVEEEDDENTNDPSPVEENLVLDLVVGPSLDNCDKRERSDRFGGEIKNERREPIRSETEPGMSAWPGGGKKRLKSLEEMTDEEFGLMAENFISSQKKLWRDENVALLTEERKIYSYTAALNFN